MYEYFLNAIKAKGLSVADVVRGTGIAKSTMSEWKSGRSTPKADKMQKIAEFLDVSVEYLLTGKNEPEFIMPDYDAREHELIEKFGILNDEQKDLVLNVISQFKTEQPEKQSKTISKDNSLNGFEELENIASNLSDVNEHFVDYYIEGVGTLEKTERKESNHSISIAYAEHFHRYETAVRMIKQLSLEIYDKVENYAQSVNLDGK